MSEISNTQIHKGVEKGEQDEQAGILALAAAGFSPREVALLLAARQRVQQGNLNEWTDDFKRLRFARWLYEHGHLEG